MNRYEETRKRYEELKREFAVAMKEKRYDDADEILDRIERMPIFV